MAAAAASSTLHGVGAVASAKPRSAAPAAAAARRSVRVAAASAKGGPGSARGRLVARGAVAVTCWLHPLSSSVMCSRFPRRADLFALCGVAVRRVQAKADEAAAAAGSKPGGHEVLMFEALREALIEEMNLDPTVCVMGEDVGHYGGSYKVTKGLADMFGDLRVLDTPIAENSFTGMGVGAAMKGLRPVVEGMNMGFLLLAYNQISNNCGMLHYTSGGQFKIPVVIRGPGGVGRQLGAEHSQRLESYFQSIPGLQMVACSTPYNAKGLMKAAIRSENPVVLFEHVLLYNLKEKIPDEEYICCLEEAEMVRPGEHVTILTYSRMRYHVMQAAKTLVNKGYDPEVIDIRSLKPFDLHTIGNSIKKTHRVLIVEECMRTGGIGASLRSAIIDNFWDYLDAPVMCLSSQDVPTPYAATLEDATVVQPAQIVAAVEQICQ
ncbi:pyruvate dehydrogenase E1 component subunit beta-3, chloroplastic-like isoform X1 [Panicum virgatum]|uniref:pyruvate dehydrogenase E1 component subunit beta-3, chloroplastic-like isoform X1 n=1 Tax=Panicum virgatum TaxID=38727 RepID=UPI0019D66AB5|nr:pyruvate dehydrogenase E1 component subunit beta-3, chloroplastic-like isoform X1 [Panicum virgatum]